ncbi:MYND finger [Colletotrichum musicola]|uniref:MYND finger n=1 Tax=Colletotrichum musicola TaxID=2175873 RepID=A0A8H6MKF4_9PEZI|nr:MYND finger [Colletotrichum musicola]
MSDLPLTSTCQRCLKDISDQTWCDCAGCHIKYCSSKCANLYWKKHKKSCPRSRKDAPPSDADDPEQPDLKLDIIALIESDPAAARRRIAEAINILNRNGINGDRMMRGHLDWFQVFEGEPEAGQRQMIDMVKTVGPKNMILKIADPPYTTPPQTEATTSIRTTVATKSEDAKEALSGTTPSETSIVPRTKRAESSKGRIVSSTRTPWTIHSNGHMTMSMEEVVEYSDSEQ